MSGGVGAEGGGAGWARIINITSPEDGGTLPWKLEDKKYVCFLKESLKRSSVFDSVSIELEAAKHSFCREASLISFKEK